MDKIETKQMSTRQHLCFICYRSTFGKVVFFFALSDLLRIRESNGSVRFSLLCFGDFNVLGECGTILITVFGLRRGFLPSTRFSECKNFRFDENKLKFIPFALLCVQFAGFYLSLLLVSIGKRRYNLCETREK